MFGLESQKGASPKKSNEVVFDLEAELKDPVTHQKYKELVHERLQEIKSSLRSGTGGEAYQVLARLVFGYSALLKVMARLADAAPAKK